MWALIIVVYTQTAPAITTVNQPFYSESVCEAAGMKIKKDLEGRAGLVSEPRSYVKFSCVIWRDR